METTPGTSRGRARWWLVVFGGVLVVASVLAGWLGLLAAVPAIALWYLTSDHARRRRRDRMTHDAERERAEWRESRLESAGVPRTEMDELTALVDQVRLAGHAHADLDALLDLFAEASIAARCEQTEHAAARRDEIKQLVQLSVARTLLGEDSPAGDDWLARRLLVIDADDS